MKVYGLKQLAAVALAGAMFCTAARADDSISPHDKQLINQLLDQLKHRKDMKFIRKDKEYDAGTAAWYLRFKWDQNKDQVHNIQDFINLESRGGKHGEVTYYVQFADGRKETAKKVFEHAFQRLERKGKN